MLESKNYHVKLILKSLLSIFIFISCEVKSPTENLKIIFNTLEHETMIVAEFFDAKDKTYISDRSVTIIFLDTYKNNIVDIGGNNNSQFVSSSGSIDFALSGEFQPSVESPVIVRGYVSAPGYLTKIIQIVLTKKGLNISKIHLAKTNNLPEGVESYSEISGKTNDNGIVIDSLFVKSNYHVEVYVPLASKIIDKNGSPLTGVLKTTIYYNNLESEESWSARPGGYRFDDGTYITPLNFYSIQIEDNFGREAAFIENPQLTDDFAYLDVPLLENNYNPETGANYSPGDSVSLWYYDLNNGRIYFKEHAKLISTLKSGQYSKLQMPLGLRGLLRKPWNLGGLVTTAIAIPLAIDDDESGYEPCQLDVTVSGVPEGIPKYLIVSGQDNYLWNENDVFYDNTISITRDLGPPKLMDKKLYDITSGSYEIYHYPPETSCGFLLGSGGNNNCEDQTINSSLPFTPIAISVDISGICSNGSIEVRPTFPLRFRPINCIESYQMNYIQVNNGTVSINGFEAGHDYEFTATYMGAIGIVAVRIHSSTEYEILSHNMNGDAPDPVVDYSTNPPTLLFNFSVEGNCQ